MARKQHSAVVVLHLVVTAGALYAFSDRSHTQAQWRVTPAGVSLAAQSNATDPRRAPTGRIHRV